MPMVCPATKRQFRLLPCAHFLENLSSSLSWRTRIFSTVSVQSTFGRKKVDTDGLSPEKRKITTAVRTKKRRRSWERDLYE